MGWASTAAVGGYLIAGVGFSSLFLVSAGLALIAALLLFGYMRAREMPEALYTVDARSTVEYQKKEGYDIE